MLLWIEISKWKEMLSTLPLFSNIQRMTSVLDKSQYKTQCTARFVDNYLTATYINASLFASQF